MVRFLMENVLEIFDGTYNVWEIHILRASPSFEAGFTYIGMRAAPPRMHSWQMKV